MVLESNGYGVTMALMYWVAEGQVVATVAAHHQHHAQEVLVRVTVIVLESNGYPGYGVRE